MALHLHPAPEQRLPAKTLAAWREIPTAVISDEFNRAGTMAAAIKPVAPGMGFAGQALTIQSMVGDNAAMHHGLTLAWPGAVVVVDARGFVDTAVWGGILTFQARHKGCVGVVVDGAVRDVAELRSSGVAVFARGIVPAGPHKGWGGVVNGLIQCGGVAVQPGDLVVGDDDGVVVVPLDRIEGLFASCRARMAREDEMMKRIAAGESSVTVQGLAPADRIGG